MCNCFIVHDSNNIVHWKTYRDTDKLKSNGLYQKYRGTCNQVRCNRTAKSKWFLGKRATYLLNIILLSKFAETRILRVISQQNHLSSPEVLRVAYLWSSKEVQILAWTCITQGNRACGKLPICVNLMFKTYSCWQK